MRLEDLTSHEGLSPTAKKKKNQRERYRNVRFFIFQYRVLVVFLISLGLWVVECLLFRFAVYSRDRQSKRQSQETFDTRIQHPLGRRYTSRREPPLVCVRGAMCLFYNFSFFVAFSFSMYMSRADRGSLDL